MQFGTSLWTGPFGAPLTFQGIVDAAVVEYRVEQYVAKLGGRLEALRAVEFGATCTTVVPRA